MIGAREYASLFKTGQYGRLFIVSGSHARGRTFRIFVLPEGELAKENGVNNPPLNKDAIEVYGVVGGHPGWTESYGWLHEGKWQNDFYNLAEGLRRKRERGKEKKIMENATNEKVRREREVAILDSYK